MRKNRLGLTATNTSSADCNSCDHDWEHPDNIISLLAEAASADNPVHSFIVGVPGADTNDPSGCEFPPYSMRLALSAMAYAGAPDSVPQSCDGSSFSAGAGDPTTSCHFDMTQGFTAQQMADAISEVRGDVVGCTYKLPDIPEGGNLGEVNRRIADRPVAAVLSCLFDLDQAERCIVEHDNRDRQL